MPGGTTTVWADAEPAIPNAAIIHNHLVFWVICIGLEHTQWLPRVLFWVCAVVCRSCTNRHIPEYNVATKMRLDMRTPTPAAWTAWVQVHCLGLREITDSRWNVECFFLL